MQVKNKQHLGPDQCCNTYSNNLYSHTDIWDWLFNVGLVFMLAEILTHCLSSETKTATTGNISKSINKLLGIFLSI